MCAVVALGSGVGFRIDVERIVRTCLHARLAGDAAAVVEIDDAVRTGEQGLRRANLHTRRILTVIAAHHRENPAGVWKSPFLDVLHPSPVHSDWNVMFGFAGDGAGVTTDATTVVNDEAKIHGQIQFVSATG